MIGSCLVMGLDWRSLGWMEYQVALAGWNASHEPEKAEADPEAMASLKKAFRAHSVH